MTNISEIEPKPSAIAQHSSVSNEHYTPRTIIEVAREAMGSIELDPASCELANRENVRALRYFTKEDDGLAKPWDAKRIFVNPPGGRLHVGGKRTNRSQAQAFWQKAVAEWLSDREKSIVFLGFTLELMRLSQWIGRDVDPWHVLHFPFCVLRERTDFLIESEGKLIEQGDPTHANVLACITSDWAIAKNFERLASDRLGAVCIPEAWLSFEQCSLRYFGPDKCTGTLVHDEFTACPVHDDK